MQEGDYLVERYRLIRKLGVGAMGQVWLAHDALLDRHVALKHLLPGSPQSLNDELVQRAMREARLAAQLNHSNAVQIYDLIIDRNVPYVLMEYVDGETLATRLKGVGRTAPDSIRPVVRQIADALAAAHELGIVHRDVKPANILISGSGVAKLADFGIARASHDSNLTSTGLVVGTLAYMAPEVAAGDPATPASDVWALGATAYAATEGKAPFTGESSARMLYRKVSEPPPVPTAAGELSSLLQAMLATEPVDRPTAREVTRALERSNLQSWSSAVPVADTATRIRPAERTVLRAAPPPPPPGSYWPQSQPDHPTTPALVEPPRTRGGLIAALIALAVAVTGGAVAVVLTFGSGNKANAGPATSSRASIPTLSIVTVTTSPSPTVTPMPSTSTTAPSSTPAGSSGGVMRFTGPYGLSVEGPASWNNVCPGASDQYYWCADQQGFLGGYFRLRLKTTTTMDFNHDVQTEVAYFKGQRDGVVLQESTVEGWTLTSAAVDVTYSFTTSQGIERKGIERIFSAKGTTYLIGTTDVPDSWARTQHVFQELVGSAEV